MKTKVTLKPETLNFLQALIQLNIDSRDGYLEAVEHTDDSAVAVAFRELATKHNDQASELASLVSRNSGEPIVKGSVAAALHRAWIDVRGAIGQGTPAMLAEAERGEDYIKGKYEAALQETVESSVAEVYNRHYRQITLMHDSIRHMRENFQKAG